MLADFLKSVLSHLLDNPESGRQSSSPGEKKATYAPSPELGDSPSAPPQSAARTWSSPLPVCARSLALARRLKSRVPPSALSPQPPGSPVRSGPSGASPLSPTRVPGAAPHGTTRTTTLTTHGLLRAVRKLTALRRGGAGRRGHVQGVLRRRGPAPELLAPPPGRIPAPAYNYRPEPKRSQTANVLFMVDTSKSEVRGKSINLDSSLY